MAEIKGTFDKKFAAVADVLSRSLDSGEDIGASAAVFINGEPVVDIWGGFADEEKTKPWQSDTIVNNFSTTKTMTALSMLILADRGQVDLNEKVATYWPEFAQNGKEDVLVRHVLSHTSGVAGWTKPVSVADICDGENAVTLLAEQAPWWKPGTAAGYHSLTIGPLVSEVIRRVTGKTLKEFFADEVAAPLAADYHIGAREEDDHRVSNMIQSSPIRTASGDGTIMDRVFFNPYITPQISGTIPWRRADMGGGNGHGNARSVATVQSLISCGGKVGDVRLLSEAGARRAMELQWEGPDQVLGFPMRWGMGFALNSDMISQLYNHALDGRELAYWGGSGGSLVVNDFGAKMTVAFVMNRHVESNFTDLRGFNIVRTAYESLFS